LTHDRLDRHVSLRVRDPKKLLAWQDLNGAELLNVEQRDALSSLEKSASRKPGATLIENIATEASDKRWVTELSATIQKAASGNAFGPIQATFKGKLDIAIKIKIYMKSTRYLMISAIPKAIPLIC